MENKEERKNPYVRIQTDRLVLRKPCLADIEEVFSIHSDPRTNRHNPEGPMKDQDDAQARVGGWINDWTKYGIGYWSVSERPHEKVIGISGIRVMEWSWRTVLNLYYRYGPEAWGKGYATEVAKEALKAAHWYQPDLPVVVRTRPTNTAAMRVAGRIGIQRRPDLDTDHVVYVSRW